MPRLLASQADLLAEKAGKPVQYVAVHRFTGRVGDAHGGRHGFGLKPDRQHVGSRIRIQVRVTCRVVSGLSRGKVSGCFTGAIFTTSGVGGGVVSAFGQALNVALMFSVASPPQHRQLEGIARLVFIALPVQFREVVDPLTIEGQNDVSQAGCCFLWRAYPLLRRSPPRLAHPGPHRRCTPR